MAVRNRVWFVVCASVMAWSAAFGQARADDIKVGIMLPLTGNEASESTVISNAAKLAVKQVNAAGGVNGSKFELIFADTKSNPEAVKAAYAQLISQDKVEAVVGPFKSALIVAMIPEMLKEGVPTFIGGTNPRLTEEKKWMLRVRPDDSIAAAAMVTYIKEDLRASKIGVIHDNGAFGKGGANLIEKNAKDQGLIVVKREGFDFGTRDFAQAMSSLKSAGAQVVVVYAANFDESAGVEKEWAKQGRPFPYLGSPSSLSPVTLGQAGAAAEGINGVVDFAFGQSEESTKYAAAYRAEYHQEPDAIASYAYDSVMILTRAIKEVGTDKQKIRDYIFGLHGYKGVMGTYDFDYRGDGLHGVSVVRRENGKQVFKRAISLK